MEILEAIMLARCASCVSLFSILNLFALSPVAVSRYNVTDFDSYSPVSWNAVNNVKALGLGTKVAITEYYNPIDGSPSMYTQGLEGNHVHYWSMWASLAWANNSLYQEQNGGKRGMEIALFDTACYLDLAPYVDNIVFYPNIYAYKHFRFVTRDQAYHLWTPMMEHAFMADRNTYGKGTPTLFATGVEYPTLVESVNIATAGDAALVMSLGFADPWVRNSGANGSAPFAVNRVFLAAPAADAYIVLFTTVMSYNTFNGHFCSEYPSQLMKDRLRNSVVNHNSVPQNTELDYGFTYISVPMQVSTVGNSLFLFDSIYNRANVNADFYYGCYPGVWFYFAYFYLVRILNPGKIWFTCLYSETGEYFFDLGSGFDDYAAMVSQDSFGVFFQDYILQSETVYSAFCSWYVPQATPTTLPWTFDYLNNTMPDIHWFRFFRAQWFAPQLFQYRNGFCVGQRNAAMFGDFSEMFYPSTDMFSRQAGTWGRWATLMDSTFYILWGHQDASDASLDGTYTLSDWYTRLDATSGFGLLTNFNPGSQNAYSISIRFTSAFRVQCSIFFSGSARVSRRHIAIAEFHPNLSYVPPAPGDVAQPSFCMDGNPPAKKLDCNAGSYYDFFWGMCLQCRAGSFASSAGFSICTLCVPGESSQVGATQCTACSKGTQSNTGGSTACVTCIPGTFSSRYGSSTCINCELGRFADQASMSECQPCEQGEFQDSVGKTSCEKCSAVTTTVGRAATSQSECFCVAGHYNTETWHSNSNKTVTCTSCAAWPAVVSMCEGFSIDSKVVIKRGFMSKAGETLVYRCEGQGSACPFESELGISACPIEGSDIACAKCTNGYQWDAVESKCVECDEASVAMIVIAAFVIFGIIYRLRPKASTFIAKQLLDMIAFTNLSVPVQQLFDFIQFGMILGMASIDWPTNIRKFLKRLGSIIDINMYSLECKLSGDTKDAYPFAYVVLLNMIPVMFISAVAILCLPNALSRKMRELKMPSPVLGMNLVFSTTSTLFMTIFNFAVSLCYQTFDHPDIAGSKEESSLVAFPYLLVGSSKVAGMRVFSAICICVWSVCFVAIPLMIVWISPSRRAQLNFRRCTVSLLMKYKDGTSWWISVELATKVCVVLAVNIFHDAAWQYRWLGLTIVIQTCGVLVVWPYRLAKHNLGECVISLSKVCILVSGITIFDRDLEKNDILYFVVFFFAVLCLALEFVACALDFFQNKIEAYPNDIGQLDAARAVLRLVLPRDYSSNENALTKLRELKYSWSKAPGNKGLTDVGMHSSNQEDMIASLKKGEKEDLGKLSLKIKQSEVLWTIALHYQTNVPNLYAKCAEIKGIQTNLYNFLRDVLPKESNQQIDVAVIHDNLIKHSEKLKELQGLFAMPEEQLAIINDNGLV